MGLLREAPPGSVPRLLTVLRVVGAAAIAANVLDLFPDVTVDVKGHVVVVVVVVMVLLVVVLAVSLLVAAAAAAQRHDFDQAERLFLRFLHRHGRVFSAARGKPGAVHDARRGVHARVIGRLEHRVNKTKKKKNSQKTERAAAELRMRRVTARWL